MSSKNKNFDVIILAAGEGKRMRPFTNNMPKSLLKVNGRPVLIRLIKQLQRQQHINMIHVVVGFQAEKVIKEIKKLDKKVNVLVNELYKDDVNIFSLNLALRECSSFFYVFEADMLMDDNCLNHIFETSNLECSTWYTYGPFKKTQYGGILKTFSSSKQICDIKIVPSYQDNYRGYKKLTGVMKVGPCQSALFKKIIEIDCRKNIKQYYLYSWINNLNELPCLEDDLAMFSFYTFNIPEEYLKIVKESQIYFRN